MEGALLLEDGAVRRLTLEEAAAWRGRIQKAHRLKIAPPRK